MRIGFLGGVPPPLGGAGLERQMAMSAAALERAGHDVLRLETGGADDRFDVLHAFGSEPAVWHHLRHWTRNPAPLVVTSIVVVSPGTQERLMRASARMPGAMSGARMRAEVLRRADVVIAGTEYERELVTSAFGARGAVVIGNGAERVESGTPPEGTPEGGYALLLGTVSARKRQEGVLRSLAGRSPVVVAGSFAGTEDELRGWDAAVSETGAVWLGHVGDAGAVAALQSRAAALVHMSAAEVQSLAVLETLMQGTPAVLSDIPSHRELAERHPGHIELAGGPEDVPAALARLTESSPPAPPRVPTWDDVAAELVPLYERVIAARA